MDIVDIKRFKTREAARGVEERGRGE